ncbi:MAG: TonB-dependent receptor [Candidatus Eisenbacteria bacterium]|nr:TonB-dependent receptor [Candidatus Eisenbacteria bacterium]
MRPSFAPCVLSVATLSLVSIGLDPLWIGRARGAESDGTIRLRWSPVVDLAALQARASLDEAVQNVVAARPENPGLTLVLLAPGVRAEAPIVEEPSGGAFPNAMLREVTWNGVPAGRGWLELHDADHQVLERWELAIPAELTTGYDLDWTSFQLTRRPAAPDPCGQWLSFDPASLRRLPGLGEEAVDRLDLFPALATLLNGQASGMGGRLRPRSVALDEAGVLSQTPLGTAGAAVGSFDRWILTRSAVTTGSSEVAVTASGGSSGRHYASAQFGLRDDRESGSWSPVGPIELRGVVQADVEGDAGPLGVAEAKLEDNDRTAVEAGLELRFRPGGWAEAGAPLSRGVVSLDIYAASFERQYSSPEFALATAHNPKEERADLAANVGYDFAVGPLDCALSGRFRRSLSETGDGRFFDLLDRYRATAANAATSPDGIYWRGDDPGTAIDEGHLWNYYLRDFTSGREVALAARGAWTEATPFRVGVARNQVTWRQFESLDPKTAFRGVEGGGYEYTSVFGYSADGDKQAEEPGQAARQPGWTTGYLSQRWNGSTVALEAGLRWEHFSAGQRPVADLAFPSGADTILAADDLGEAETTTEVLPRLGVSWSVDPRTQLYADFGRSLTSPPFEALYYSPHLLQALDLHAREGQLLTGRGYIFGNPNLKPEATSRFHLGLAREVSDVLRVQVSAHLDRVSDTWIARPHGLGTDSLLFYENDGERRERALLVIADLKRGARGNLRTYYRLGAAETNRIQPSPLYRGLSRGLLPVQSAGTHEMRSSDPFYAEDGLDRGFFPALGDRTHRLAFVYEARLSEGGFFGLLPHVDVALTARFASGLPYTRTYVREEGAIDQLGRTPRAIDPLDIQGERTAWSSQIDLALEHEMLFFGKPLRMRVEGRNLLDQRNPRTVYGATGEADDDGWLDSASGRDAAALGGDDYISAYRDKIESPLNVEDGASIRAAVSVRY